MLTEHRVGAVFRHAPGAGRAERRQADTERVREARLRLAARTGSPIPPTGPVPVARRAVRSGQAANPVSGNRARAAAADPRLIALHGELLRAAAATSNPSAQIAPRWALLPSVAASMRSSIVRPMRPMRARNRNSHWSAAATRAMAAKPSRKARAERRSRIRSMS